MRQHGWPVDTLIHVIIHRRAVPMIKKLTVALLVIFALLTVLHQQPHLLAAPLWQSGTPTPAPTEEPVEESVDAPAAEEMTAEPTISDLMGRIDALQAQVDQLTATIHPAASPAEVTTAVYLLDTAGLHGLDERLNGEGVIEASDAGNVGRVARLLSSVVWPEPLAADAAALVETLRQLASALRDDDLEAAAPLATQAHEDQHDFSHEAEHWLGEADVSTTPPAGQAFRVTSAVYLLDTAGLHGLDVRLNEEGVIEARDAGVVGRVARLLSSVDWPHDLSAAAADLIDVLTQLGAALANDDLAAAAPLATQAHEDQHAFSHEAEHWLGELTGEHDDETADDHSDDESSEEGDGHDEEDEESSESSGG
jgi:hypothetical protein